MAKQCIYCGRPLPKDDARFCNDCGRAQVMPTSPGATSGQAGPSAIKVKLPPKEFTRRDASAAWQEDSLPAQTPHGAPLSSPQREQVVSLPEEFTRRDVSAWQEDSLPGQTTYGAPLSSPQREQAASSRMPKRPARLASQEALPPVEKKAEAAGDALSPVTRLASSVQTSGPTPAEEISTMVLPNWREELAQLRKGQEQAGATASAAAEKKVERTAAEPPSLPRQAPSTPFPPHEGRTESAQPSQPRPQAKPFSDLSSGGRAPQDSARLADPPRQAPSTPLPQENARQVDASRRELHVKVWEQEATIRYPQTQEEQREPGPAPTAGQNPISSAAFNVKEPVSQGENLDAFAGQAAFNPSSASSGRSSLKEESQSPTKKEQDLAVEKEKQLLKEEKRSPMREEAPQALKEENRRTAIEKKPDDIEDLPTRPLAVPEVAKPEAQIKVERASTPAPRKWSTPPADEVEDLPTRPMATSSTGFTGSAAPHMPSQPVAPQTQSAERRPEAGQVEAAAPSGQKVPNPFSSPGIYGQAPAVQAQGQVMETATDPQELRGRPAPPQARPGPRFDPASLPPLAPGPLSMPGNTQLWSGAPGPQARPSMPAQDAFGQRPPQAPAEPFGQRPPSFGPPSASPSVFPNVSRPTADATVDVEKPRKKRPTGRILVGLLLILVIAGGAAWYVLYQPFTVAAVSQPYQAYQNSAFGVSLEYTQGWKVSVDQLHNALKIADSTHTGQITLTMATASGQVGDYLNRQATQLQMSGLKTSPAVTFGGSSWQVVQGIVTQAGVTYTIALYSTQHNGHFYTLEFQAPQVSFTHTDQNNFAHLRSSFSFI